MASVSKVGIITLVCFFVSMTTVRTQSTQSPLPKELQGEPCSNPRSIKLPKSNKCLVLVKEARSWVSAQGTCERAGGWLYLMPSAILYTRPRLMDCLSSINGTDFTDLWLNGVSLWSPHFIWNNRTFVNKVTYCPDLRKLPKFKGAPITSDSLSVDYCVSTCHDQGARFTVVYSQGSSPNCNCLHSLDPSLQVPCADTAFNAQDISKMYIVHSQENSLIKVGSADTFSSTEIMCGTVDTNTFVDRELGSDTCFTERPFLCQLGTADECKAAKVELACQGKECFFPCRNKCLKRVNLPYNWYAARSYCAGLGGDIWMIEGLDDMSQVNQHLDTTQRYWIGTSNYVWNFNATKSDFQGVQAGATHYRCGHMIREISSGALGRRWTWSDALCQQNKSFLCEFDDDQFTEDQRGQNVSCPWGIIYPDPLTPRPIATGAPVSGITLQTVVHDSSFPIGAVIAGIIAGLILLTCLGLTLAFCGRRHWSKVREHLTFIPYFSDNGHAMMGNSHEFENMSQVGRSHMSSVSEHGSQTGLVKGGYSSYATHTESNGMFSSKSLDRRHVDSMGQKLADSQNYLASANNSMDERGFGATYATMPSRQKEYMTLQAHMDIQDDAQLEAMRRSLRGKPEMALVTDNADMNLTINHASSHNGAVVGNLDSGGASAGQEFIIESGTVTAGGNGGVNGSSAVMMVGSGGGGVGSGNANAAVLTTGNGFVIEESTLPAVTSEGGVILTFPERIQEAHVYSTSPTVHVQHTQHHLNVM